MPGTDPGRNPSDPIVVTGLGTVTALGWGLARLWAGASAATVAIGPFDRFDAASYRTAIAAQVRTGPDAPPAGRRSSIADRFALAASLEAVRQAGLPVADLAEATGVYFGSSTGGMIESEIYYEQLIRRGRRHARPSLLASQQFNGPGDTVARALGAAGPVVTISSACASGAIAIGLALAALRRGEVEAAVAGGSDSLCRLTYAGFNALRSVDERPCRPFRADRMGLSLGEGAGVLVLERISAAARRGARPLAVLAGWGTTCDAHHMTAPRPDGAGAARAIALALEDAGVGPEEVDFINAHGTGTPLNDAAEGAAIARVFGERAARIPVTSTKALIGHLLGSAGAVEAAVTVLCLSRREVHPMPEAGALDPSLDLDLVLGTPRAVPGARCALSTSLAFGGANAALVFTRPAA